MWKADVAKIIIALTIFAKHSIVDVGQGSEFTNQRYKYTYGSEYDRVLNIQGFWVC